MSKITSTIQILFVILVFSCTISTPAFSNQNDADKVVGICIKSLTKLIELYRVENNLEGQFYSLTDLVVVLELQQEKPDPVWHKDLGFAYAHRWLISESLNKPEQAKKDLKKALVILRQVYTNELDSEQLRKHLALLYLNN